MLVFDFVDRKIVLHLPNGVTKPAPKQIVLAGTATPAPKG